MQGVDPMRAFGILLALCVFMFCISSESFGNGVIKKGRGTDNEITGSPMAGPAAGPVKKSGLRSANASCRIVRTGHKPLAWTLEDGVAYALDIPLAMLTPFVTAITPIMDNLDYGCDNHYPRRERK
jgi:hypothetical protein